MTVILYALRFAAGDGTDLSEPGESGDPSLREGVTGKKTSLDSGTVFARYQKFRRLVVLYATTSSMYLNLSTLPVL